MICAGFSILQTARGEDLRPRARMSVAERGERAAVEQRLQSGKRAGMAIQRESAKVAYCSVGSNVEDRCWRERKDIG